MRYAIGGMLTALGAVAVATIVGPTLVNPPASAAKGSSFTAADLAGVPAPDRKLTLASRRWQRLTRPPIASLRPLGGAHPGGKTIRVSRTRAQLTAKNGRQRFPYPRRTVIVKTATNGGVVTLVAIMRKIAAGNDIDNWRFVEYTRSGAGQRFSLVGGGQGLCTGCHVSATTTQRSDGAFYRLS